VRYLPLALVALALVACTGEPSHGWRRLAAPPSAAPGASVVWTGARLFYWGGESEYGAKPVGGLYDPDEGRWTKLPPAPMNGRSYAPAVWTGNEVVVWALRLGAAFDPKTGRWRRLPPAPLGLLEPPAYVWTGKELIVCCSDAPRSPTGAGAAYEPSTNRWRRIRSAPLALERASAIWTGRNMVVLGRHVGEEKARGIAYDPRTDRWQLLPRFPLSPYASSIVFAGGQLIAWDYLLTAAAYEPDQERWRSLPRIPLDDAECPGASASTGDVLLAWYCGQAATFDRARGTWRRIPRAPKTVWGSPVAADGVFYFAGAWPDADHATLWEYRP
jgi:hypothetical protein